MPCGIVECITWILNDTKFVHELECEGPEGFMAVVSSLSDCGALNCGTGF